MSTTPSTPRPAPAQVCERLKAAIDNCPVGQRDLLTAALTLLEQGELAAVERERLEADVELHKQLLAQRDSENADTLIEAVKIERERNALRKQLAAATERVKALEAAIERFDEESAVISTKETDPCFVEVQITSGAYEGLYRALAARTQPTTESK